MGKLKLLDAYPKAGQARLCIDCRAVLERSSLVLRLTKIFLHAPRPGAL